MRERTKDSNPDRSIQRLDDDSNLIELLDADEAVKWLNMIVQKSSATGTFPVIISVLSVLLYFGGFFRVEIALNKHQGRIIELEEVVEGLKTIVNNGNRNLFDKAIDGKLVSFGLPLFSVSGR